MYDDLKVKDKKHLDEGDRLQGEDMMTYLNRKNEAQKVLERMRTQWLRKQFRLEKNKRIWEKDIFPNWDNIRYTRKVRELWSEGLPRSLRGRVWFLAFGNRSAITKDLFNIMAERGAKLKGLLKSQSAQEQLVIETGGEIPYKGDQLFYPKYDQHKYLNESEDDF